MQLLSADTFLLTVLNRYSYNDKKIQENETHWVIVTKYMFRHRLVVEYGRHVLSKSFLHISITIFGDCPCCMV